MAKLIKKRTITAAENKTFDKIGQEHVGTLTAIRDVIVKGDERVVYDLISLDGKPFMIWATAMLERMVTRSLIGKVIGIKWVEEIPSDDPDRNATRIFEINEYEIEKSSK